MPGSRIAALAAISLLAACAGTVELVAKPAAVPAGIDLSGRWLLRDTAGSTQRRARQALVYAFVETGRSVKVTQTDAGLFVSFDRSVVEEYRFGENRRISVGEVTAQRVSGWEDGAYVVETLDREGDRLVDVYRLAAGGQELVRRIVIWSGDKKILSLEQVFDRI